ncbi:mitochondrial import inner membrane translocase subunit TIM16 [Vanrija albida]|uniref:Mitochondrial import inner membrane translocase subunit TIM16 n=1 Tax=Vanrija albida TaxID=181172 RepID=A0ABR3PU06_9TREE
MSAPRAMAELVVSSIRIFGKAMAAAGKQAARNARHKPEGAPDSRPVGGGSGKNKITNDLQMTIDEAHLILNVKKEAPMEDVLKQYEAIFKANGPPAPPPEPAPGSPQAAALAAQKARGGPKAKKGPTHSHYLQSKVYRALERIKAERADELGAAAAAEGAAAEGAAAEGAAAAGEAAAAEAPKPGDKAQQ